MHDFAQRTDPLRGEAPPLATSLLPMALRFGRLSSHTLQPSPTEAEAKVVFSSH